MVKQKYLVVSSTGYFKGNMGEVTSYIMDKAKENRVDSVLLVISYFKIFKYLPNGDLRYANEDFITDGGYLKSQIDFVYKVITKTLEAFKKSPRDKNLVDLGKDYEFNWHYLCRDAVNFKSSNFSDVFDLALPDFEFNGALWDICRGIEINSGVKLRGRHFMYTSSAFSEWANDLGMMHTPIHGDGKYEKIKSDETEFKLFEKAMRKTFYSKN